jgi:hypothetical protein
MSKSRRGFSVGSMRRFAKPAHVAYRAFKDEIAADAISRVLSLQYVSWRAPPLLQPLSPPRREIPLLAGQMIFRRIEP